MTNNEDKRLIDSILKKIETLVEPGYIINALAQTNKFKNDREAESNIKHRIKICFIEHPLDNDIKKKLKNLDIRQNDDEFRIFNYIDDIKDIWKTVISKSIKCLRYFDEREPFIENENKHPIAYGAKELSDYFEKYTEFESMLYGGGKYYRDHVVHVFRVWLLGMECLLDHEGEYLKKINIHPDFKISNLEKLSIWSMIALTHDLGYPLEKSQSIIEKTKNMMRSFVANSDITMDLSFSGIQNNMNDFVIRFMSSKMHKVNQLDNAEFNSQIATKIENATDRYVARLQPKYYFKLQKSLERNNHGVLSAIIIYKLLIYFLESDFNVNEDYVFDSEEARQFYIRREILRTISAHTCHDIYHLDMFTFAFLLIMMDDAQEWGRKRISELYTAKNSNYEFKGLVPKFDERSGNKFIIREKFSLGKDEEDSLKDILKSLWNQSRTYAEIFRDGQDTGKRNFDFEKECEIEYTSDKHITFKVKFVISNKERSTYTIVLESVDDQLLDSMYNVEFFNKIFGEYGTLNKHTLPTYELIIN